LPPIPEKELKGGILVNFWVNECLKNANFSQNLNLEVGLEMMGNGSLGGKKEF